MNQAVVLASGTGINGESLESFGEIPVAEVPQIKRLLINAERAGLSNFTIVCDEDLKPSLIQLVNDKRIKSSVKWATPGEIFDLDSQRVLILQTNLLTHQASIENFIQKASKSNSVSILAEEVNEKNSSDNMSLFGMVAIDGEHLRQVLKTCNLSKLLNSSPTNGNISYVTPDEGYWMNITGDNSEVIGEAEDLIFSNVGKTATGWIARNVNGSVSLPISRLLIKTPLTPNMISILINIIGMLSGPFYAFGYPILGAIFMQIATVLDRCDGEVARVKLMETKTGQWVDTLSDQVTVLSFIIGVSIGYYLESGSLVVLSVGAIDLFIFIFFLIWSFYFLVRYTDSGSLVAYYQVDKLVDVEKSSWARKLIRFLRPLGRRNVYSMAFLIFAIIGGSKLVFWVLTLALILFFIHQVEDLIKISKLKNISDK